MEISQKREALENVLIPYKLSENISLLRDTGFAHCEVFFKWYNFAALSLQKNDHGFYRQFLFKYRNWIFILFYGALFIPSWPLFSKEQFGERYIIPGRLLLVYSLPFLGN
jgi:hypothetical protein